MNVLFWLSIGLDNRSPSEHLLLGIIEALYQQGHTVHVLQKDSGGEVTHVNQRLRDIGVSMTLVPSRPLARGNLIKRYMSDLKYVFTCVKHIRRLDNIDAVFLQSSNVAGLQAFVLDKILQEASITYNAQDIFPENAMHNGILSKKGFVYRTLTKIQKYAYKHSRHIITISEDLKSTLVGFGVDPEKIEVIYNWSYQDDLYSFENVDCSKVSHIFDAKFFNVVYAGNIGRMQNIDVLVRAAGRMKEYEGIWFHIIGDGVYKEKLQKNAEELKIQNITFWPMMSTDLAPAIYSSADVNIIPLAENIYKTALPSKTATCLACQKPIIFCIGKDSRFAQKIHSKTNCPVLDTSDVEELIQAILSLKSRKNMCKPYDDYSYDFSKSANSNRYANTIVN